MSKGSVLVAMSGGVDSSFAAYLLKESSYAVKGITMLIADDDDAKSIVEEAGKVCDYLKIEHLVLDLSREFKEKIVDYFIEEYLRGRTPNPCVACNKYLKFNLLYNESIKSGFDFFATGHFARIDRDKPGNYLLKKGKDPIKDQSYFLYSIERDYLSRIIFPLGDYLKKDVLEIATKNKIPFSEKGPSQDLCFTANNNYKNFIKNNIREVEPGNIVDRDGNILGHHSGIPFYTIGQREGLGIAAPSALYVVDIDPKNNNIVVGDRENLKSKGLIASNLNIFNNDLSSNDLDNPVFAKIRYKHSGAKCKMCKIDNDRLTVIFCEPQDAVTPGQSVVLYRDGTVLGGGIIEEVIK